MAKASARVPNERWESIEQNNTIAQSRGAQPSSEALRQTPLHSGASNLDRLIHERIRLGIVSALAVNDRLSFNELKKLLGTTDGNLSVHALKLEDARYINSRKYFDGRIPRTDYCLTEEGRQALDRYLEHMEALIHATRQR